MIVKIHKIHWPARYTAAGKDINFTVTDVDCMVTEVSHSCARWAIGEYWHRASSWFERKHAIIMLGEPKEIQNETKS